MTETEQVGGLGDRATCVAQRTFYDAALKFLLFSFERKAFPRSISQRTLLSYLDEQCVDDFQGRGNQAPDSGGVLEKSQDPAAVRRLVSSALKIIDALLVQIAQEGSLADGSWEGFSLKREKKKFESRIIERALRDAGGSVTKAAHLLGFGHHQSLISLLGSRHRELQGLRSVKRRRRRPLLAKLKRGKKPTPALDPRTAKFSILHVEDHKPVAKLVEELLNAEGIHVDACANGTAALEILKGDTHYDALVVDNNLPGLSGLELVLRVRSMPKRRNLPTIMLSGDDCEREAWRAGVDAFL